MDPYLWQKQMKRTTKVHKAKNGNMVPPHKTTALCTQKEYATQRNTDEVTQPLPANIEKNTVTKDIDDEKHKNFFRVPTNAQNQLMSKIVVDLVVVHFLQRHRLRRESSWVPHSFTVMTRSCKRMVKNHHPKYKRKQCRPIHLCMYSLTRECTTETSENPNFNGGHDHSVQ